MTTSPPTTPTRTQPTTPTTTKEGKHFTKRLSNIVFNAVVQLEHNTLVRERLYDELREELGMQVHLKKTSAKEANRLLLELMSLYDNEVATKQ